MKALINYFIKYPVAGNLLMFLIFIFGYFGMNNMRSTFFPQAPVRNVAIQVVYPGASAEEIEESVVLKIEDQLTGVIGVDRITSTSSENAASLDVEIKMSADIDDVLQDVKNAVDQISSFPIGLESTNIYKKEPINNAVSFSIIGSDDLFKLKAIARKIERDLLSKDGISKVNLSGFPDEEISIEFNEEKLRSYGITMDEVVNKVAASNIEITGGTIKGTKEEYKIRMKNKSYYGKDMQDMVILSKPDGSLVRLSDMADIKDRWADAPDRNFLNGEPAVTIDIQYTNDEDLLNIVDDAKAYIADFNEDNADNALNISIINDQSKTVRERIQMLVDNGLLGFVIVFLLLAMFLHYRLAFWVALSIPIAFGGMFILSSGFAVTINVISLFGMITVIGILVDDGVVVSENIYRHFEMGKNRMQAAIDGTLEVMPAVFSAILTTVIVFSTFFFIDGRLGDFFSEMAFIVIATLIFSLVEGLFILPAHVGHSKALDRNLKPNAIMRGLTNFMNWMKNKLYKPVLTFSLNNTALAAAIPIGLLMITMGAMEGGIIKSTFFPTIEQDNIKVNLKLPAGTREQVTKFELDRIEAAVWRVNEFYKNERNVDIILSSDKRIGPKNGHLGTLKVELLGGEERNLKQAEVIAKLREEVGAIPGAEEFTFGSGNPFGKPVSVSLRGPDMVELREVVEEVKGEMMALVDLKDVTDSDVKGTKEVVLKLKEKAYLLGFTEQSIMGQVRRGFFGGEAQRIQRGLDEVKVWVRYEDESRKAIKQLKDIEIVNSNGRYRLEDLAYFSVDRGVVSIQHTDGKKEITVESDIASGEVSASDMIANMKTNVLPRVLASHPDISFSFEGQSRQQAKSQQSILKVMPIILILMISVIILTFRSFSQTLVVMLLIPFGFIGVAWGHWVHGMQVSLFSILGMIALIGILINDALVFVSAFNINIKGGMKYRDAIREAALSRFRPIVLTSITTIAGLAPLILEKSFQAQFLIPMALSIAYGLAVATLIILVILPVLLLSVNRAKRFLKWWWFDQKPKPEAVEPAFKELSFEEHE
jgi:multidrug efflux pump subunit AcrB